MSPFSLNQSSNYLSQRRKFRVRKRGKSGRRYSDKDDSYDAVDNLTSARSLRLIISLSPGAVARTSVFLMKFVRAGVAKKGMAVEGGEGELKRKRERIPDTGDEERRTGCPGEKCERKGETCTRMDEEMKRRKEKRGTHGFEARRAWK